MSTITATVYKLPDGRKETIIVRNIHSDDADWFESNNIKISMEELQSGEIVVYGEMPFFDQDTDEPMEFLELAQGRSCEETFASLRKDCQEYLEKSK